jgi:hypothetical protein
MLDHRTQIASDYLHQESIDSIQWPAMSPDMNSIEHLWDDIGRKINDRVPACQNLQELRDALNVCKMAVKKLKKSFI